MECYEWRANNGLCPSFFSFLGQKVTLSPAKSQTTANKNNCGFLNSYILPKLHLITCRIVTNSKLTLMEKEIHK